MKFYIILLMLLSNLSFSKDVRLFWYDNPVEDNVTKYAILLGEEPNILRTDLNGNYYYNYKQYEYSNIPYCLFSGLDDTKNYYFVVVAYSETNNSWSFPSKEVKITPINTLKNSLLLQRNAITNLPELKYTVTGNSGSYIAIESSTNLVEWSIENLAIIDTGDIFSTVFPISGPTKFFKTVVINSNNYQKYDPSLFDVTIQPQTVNFSVLNTSVQQEQPIEENIQTTRLKKPYDKERYRKHLKKKNHKRHG